ncbi:Ff.00g013300.m01.CDS01 [Fusarium sp. VM40]|nr:Ff.00g013300.m01.CDS01 [Fusarium sp. VM40]
MSGTPTSGLLDDIVRDSRLETYYEWPLTIHLRNDPHTRPLTQKQKESWKKVRTLGYGGQGQVVLEKCVEGKPAVTERAVKKIRLQTDDSRRRYEEELATILKFSHDNYSQYFVKSLGWYARKEKLYLAMEYLPAGDLFHYVCEYERLVEDDCREIVSQLVSGLALMHAEGFAHRDVNPKNILINRHPQGDNPGSWWVKLADFGISKRLGTDTNATTYIPGTRLYMAPELIDRDSINPPRNDYLKADVWSLGITAFFILTKNIPFHNPSSIQGYGRNPAVSFPYGLLDHHQVSEAGQAFIREVTKPFPNERIGAEEARHLEWIRDFLPEIPILGTNSRSSTVSSTRTSIDSQKWLTAEIATLASQPTSRGMNNENHPAWMPPQFGAPSRSNSEAVTLHESLIGRQSESQPSIRGVVSYEDLVYALLTRNVEAAKTIINSNFNTFMQSGWTPLHLSVAYNNVQVAEYLIDNGANIHVTRDNGNTPLHVSACNGHEAVTRHLLKNGANIEAKTDLGYTPLHLAAHKGHHAVAKVLLESGADIEAEDKWGRTSLVLAVGKGFTPVVKLLLGEGAGTEVRNEDHETSLILAVKEGRDGMVKLLLEKKADIEATDRQGRTPLMIAAQKKHKALVKLLVQNRAKKGMSYYLNRFGDLV